MPLFDIAGNSLLPVEQKNFTREKELQKLIEQARDMLSRPVD